MNSSLYGPFAPRPGTNPGFVAPPPGRNPFVSNPFGPAQGIGGTVPQQMMRPYGVVNPNAPGSLNSNGIKTDMMGQQMSHTFVPHGGDPTGGVRPGVYNGPNAVEAAGGSYVPPSMQGRDPSNPHNAVLAAYPGQ